MNIKSQNLDVLIVEDSLSYALELDRLCVKIGFNVIGMVDSSGDTLDAIYANEPDVVLMDIEINGKMNGLEIGQKIIHTEIPIIYITSFSDEKRMNEARTSNMIGYLVKPVSEVSLLQSLQKIVKREFGINEDGIES